MEVAVVKYREGNGSLKEALELCDGLKNLKRSDRIFIKPNVVAAGPRKLPPHGMTTTPQIMTELLTLLKDIGCDKITIGEGSIVLDEFKLNTRRAMDWSGLQAVAERFGVRVSDLNEGAFSEIDVLGEEIEVSNEALEADFFINLPVLKTHNQAVVSLGLKNLKGCLSFESKKRFHGLNLDHMIAELGTKIPCHLTIIDGLYALECGPLLGSPLTKPHRFDVIIAGTEILGVDLVGADILGYSQDEVGYLRRFAERTENEAQTSDILVKGERLDDVRRPLTWSSPWAQNMFTMAGIEGISFPSPGTGLCSGCGYTIAIGCANFVRSVPGKRFDNVHVCAGGKVKPGPENENVVLLGQCAVKNNKNVQNALKAKGCPPSPQEVTECLEGLQTIE